MHIVFTDFFQRSPVRKGMNELVSGRNRSNRTSCSPGVWRLFMTSYRRWETLFYYIHCKSFYLTSFDLSLSDYSRSEQRFWGRSEFLSVSLTVVIDRRPSSVNVQTCHCETEIIRHVDRTPNQRIKRPWKNCHLRQRNLVNVVHTKWVTRLRRRNLPTESTTELFLRFDVLRRVLSHDIY